MTKPSSSLTLVPLLVLLGAIGVFGQYAKTCDYSPVYPCTFTPQQQPATSVTRIYLFGAEISATSVNVLPLSGAVLTLSGSFDTGSGSYRLYSPLAVNQVAATSMTSTQLVFTLVNPGTLAGDSLQLFIPSGHGYDMNIRGGTTYDLFQWVAPTLTAVTYPYAASGTPMIVTPGTQITVSGTTFTTDTVGYLPGQIEAKLDGVLCALLSVSPATLVFVVNNVSASGPFSYGLVVRLGGYAPALPAGTAIIHNSIDLPPALVAEYSYTGLPVATAANVVHLYGANMVQADWTLTCDWIGSGGSTQVFGPSVLATDRVAFALPLKATPIVGDCRFAYANGTTLAEVDAASTPIQYMRHSAAIAQYDETYVFEADIKGSFTGTAPFPLVLRRKGDTVFAVMSQSLVNAAGEYWEAPAYTTANKYFITVNQLPLRFRPTQVQTNAIIVVDGGVRGPSHAQITPDGYIKWVRASVTGQAYFTASPMRLFAFVLTWTAE